MTDCICEFRKVNDLYRYSGFMPMSGREDGISWYADNYSSDRSRFLRLVAGDERGTPSRLILTTSMKACWPTWLIEALGVTHDKLEELREAEAFDLNGVYWLGYYNEPPLWPMIDLEIQEAYDIGKADREAEYK